MKHANIAIFVPHNGCPHQCSFCNQKNITGTNFQPRKQHVINAIETSLSKNTYIENREVAFFGGSFTAISHDYMIELLESVQPYIEENEVNGIRISTRPDAISDEILDILKKYNVTAIELGAQSMHNRVLELNERGHNANDVIVSATKIKEYGFELGLQMMVGLYGSNREKDLFTGNMFVKLKPKTVRIYPTLIMKDTKLAQLYKEKLYLPMEFNETVDICTELLKIFEVNNINVIRLGLHSSESLENNLLAGVWHPAFREICESKLLLDKFINKINILKTKNKKINVYLNPKDLSKFIGQKQCNITELKSMGFDLQIIKDNKVKRNSLKIEEQ